MPITPGGVQRELCPLEFQGLLGRTTAPPMDFSVLVGELGAHL
jgi:hypothetical protein